MMRTGILSAIAFSAIVLNPVVAKAVQQPAAPSPMQLPYQSANLPTYGQVQAFYANYHYSPIWFSGNALKPEATALVQILQRSSTASNMPPPRNPRSSRQHPVRRRRSLTPSIPCRRPWSPTRRP